MRTALFAAALAISAQLVSAADTAYTALRVVGKDQGEAVLNRVVELRGKFGAPQPQVWKITTKEAGARGGLREFEVQRGKLISQRTPVSRSVGTPMNFNQLNLDSEGVFTIAEQEAKKVSVVFDRADYTLRSGTQGGAPVWTVELFSGRKGRVGTFEIAADSGAVLRQEVATVGNPDVASEDREFLDGEESRNGRARDEERVDESHGLPGFFNKVERHFKRRGKQFENFFTGKGFRED
jgi:hypothetical protein